MNILAAQYVAAGVRPLDALTTNVHEGWAVGQNATVGCC
jgi:hypothetical protein